jgi:hypothetical protein
MRTMGEALYEPILASEFLHQRHLLHVPRAAGRGAIQAPLSVFYMESR